MVYSISPFKTKRGEEEEEEKKAKVGGHREGDGGMRAEEKGRRKGLEKINCILPFLLLGALTNYAI